MTKRHLKRIKAPGAWLFPRKEAKFTTRPNPGKHSPLQGVSLRFALTDLMCIAKTAKETNYIVSKQDVLVDGKRVHNPRAAIGLMDVISFPKLKKSYTITLDLQGNLVAEELDEKFAGQKTDKIVRKHKHAGKVQLTLMDGRTLLLDEKKASYKVGDSIVLELPKQTIKKHIPLEKGADVLLIGGSKIGHKGKIQEIEGKNITFSLDKETHTTKKSNALAIP